MPILGVLNANRLTDVVAVVTRYFGGIKLGAGGLVRAYSDAVAQAVAAAGTRQVVLCSLIAVEVPLADAGALESQIRGLVLPGGVPVVVDGVDWGMSASIRAAVPRELVPEFNAAITSLSSGRLTGTTVGERWTDQT